MRWLTIRNYGGSWRKNLIEDLQGIRDVLAATRRVAVLGIRSEQYSSRPAFYVLQRSWLMVNVPIGRLSRPLISQKPD